MEFRVSSFDPIKRLLRNFKIYDPIYSGELSRWKSSSISKSYFSRDGKSIDEIGELLYDFNYISERPDEREVLSLLDDLFRNSSKCFWRCRSAKGNYCNCICKNKNHGMDAP